MKEPRDYCEYCRASINGGERLVTVHRHRGGKHFIFESVPARVCLHCGERYFSAPVVREMDRLIAARKRWRSTVSVPVIALRRAGCGGLQPSVNR